MVETGQKRKRPPTFQHLPLNRAKKLKQKWVENVKIKSKWKVQKRKEASSIVSPPSPTQSRGGNDEEHSSVIAEDSESESEVEKPIHSTLHPSRAHIHPELAPKITTKPKRLEKDEGAPEGTPSLRDLTKQAYSRSSLHTFKADPLNRGQRTQTRGRGNGRGKGVPRGERGRGQPNMKLRMDAMLEKIKRDFT